MKHSKKSGEPFDLGAIDPAWRGFMLHEGTLGIPQCPWTVRPGEVVSIPIRSMETEALRRQLVMRPAAPPVPTVEELRTMTFEQLDSVCAGWLHIKDEAWRMWLQRRDEQTARAVHQYKLENESRKVARAALAAQRKFAKEERRRVSKRSKAG